MQRKITYSFKIGDIIFDQLSGCHLVVVKKDEYGNFILQSLTTKYRLPMPPTDWFDEFILIFETKDEE
jgi:hypothetical protein